MIRILSSVSRADLFAQLVRLGFAQMNQVTFVRQPMRVGGLWECEVAV